MEISAEKTKLVKISANGIKRKVKLKGHKLVQSSLEQLFQLMALIQRFSQGLHKPLQLLQRWSQIGDMTIYL